MTGRGRSRGGAAMGFLPGVLAGVLLASPVLAGGVVETGTSASRPYERAIRSPRLAQVKQLQAVPQGEGILLRWSPVAGCDGYRIYHEESGKVRRDSPRIDVDRQVNPYLFVDVARGEWYSFRVSALRVGKEGPLSKPASVQMLGESATVLSDCGK
jgi:hypothetical protein